MSEFISFRQHLHAGDVMDASPKKKCVILSGNDDATFRLFNILQRIDSECRIEKMLDLQDDWTTYLKEEKIDIVFLVDSFENHQDLSLLDRTRLENRYFQIVYITEGENNHALLKYSVLACLPFQFCIEDIMPVFQRMSKLYPRESSEAFTPQLNRIVIPDNKGFRLVNLEDVSHLNADGAYTYIYLKDNTRLFITKRLKDFDYLLDFAFFFKPHRSFIVNLYCVKAFVKADGGYLVLDDGSSISISRDKYKSFSQLFLGNK